MVSSFDQRGSVHVRGGIGVEATTLNEDEHGSRPGIVGRSVDVEKEAVFGKAWVDVGGRRGKTDISVLNSLAHEIPNEKIRHTLLAN